MKQTDQSDHRRRSILRAERKGFTLIELSVAVGIIGVLVSVALPAALQARHAARRAHCQNNLRQMGVALHNFHDSFQRFPPGWSSIQFTDDGAIPRPADLGCLWAWGAYILPQLDQSGLYDQLGVSGFRDPPAPGEALDVPVSTFTCPSDSAVLESGWGLYRWDGTGPSPEPALVKGYQKSSYIAVSGNDLPSPLAPHFATAFRSPGAGIFDGDSRTRMADVLDGMSQTLALGEREMHRTYDKRRPRGAVWIRNVGELVAATPLVHPRVAAASNAAPHGLHNLGLWPLIAIHCDERSVAGVTSRESPINRSEFGFSSLHPGGANFLFGDGAVRLLSEGIDSTTYENLGSMADGRPLGEF